MRTMVAFLMALVSGLGCLGQDARATVIQVVGTRAAVDAGSRAGIREGAVFRLYSPTRIIRIPLTDTVTMQSGEPVGTLVADEVKADRAWGEVTMFGEGVELRTGMDAVFVGVRSLQTMGSLSIEAEADTVGPGDWVAIKVKGAPAGSVYEWRASAGWLSSAWSLSPVVQWVAPTAAGKAEISVRAVAPGSSEYKASVAVNVREGTYVVSGKFQQHLITGRMLSSGGEPRVSDVVVNSDGLYYIDLRMQGLYRHNGVMGITEIAGPNKGRKLMAPYDLAIFGGKAFILDDDFYKLKRYDLATGEQEAILGKEANMQDPVALAVGANGLVYVLDRGARSIHVIESMGAYRLSFGKKGTGKGEFSEPVAIALDADGNIHVLDARRKVVVVYDPAMGLKEEWGLQLRARNTPRDLEISANGDIWVLEGPQIDVVKYKAGGKLVLRAEGGVLANLPPEALKISTDAAGNLYVIPGNRAGIYRFSPEGAFTGAMALSGVRTPVGFAVNPAGGFMIHYFEPPFVDTFDAGGWNLCTWGAPFNEPVRFNLPGRLAFRPDGRAVYALGASDVGAFALARRTLFAYLFSPEGKLLEFFGGEGEAYGRFLTMNDCDVDASGGFWVLDNKAMRVTGFSSDRGMPIVRNLLRGKNERHELASPALLAIAPDAKSFFIYDDRLRAIKQFDRESASLINMLDLTTIKPYPEDIPRIKAGPLGYVYVLDRARAAVHVIDFKTGPAGRAVLAVERPDGKLTDMGIDAAGRVLVVSDKGTVYALSKR